VAVKRRQFTLQARALLRWLIPHLHVYLLQGCADAPRNFFRDAHFLEHVPQSL
jgi:hypothetical protein